VFVDGVDEPVIDSRVQAIGAPTADTLVLDVAGEAGGAGQSTQLGLLELAVPWEPGDPAVKSADEPDEDGLKKESPNA